MKAELCAVCSVLLAVAVEVGSLPAGRQVLQFGEARLIGGSRAAAVLLR